MVKLNTNCKIVFAMAALLITTQAHAAIFGLAFESIETPVTVESVGSALNPKLKITFTGTYGCDLTLNPYIEGMTTMDGQPVPYGENSEKLLTLGITQLLDCTRQKDASFNGNAPTGSITQIIDLNSEVFSAKVFNSDKEAAPYKQAFEFGIFNIQLTIQEFKVGAFDSSLKYLTIKSDWLKKSQLIYKTGSSTNLQDMPEVAPFNLSIKQIENRDAFEIIRTLFNVADYSKELKSNYVFDSQYNCTTYNGADGILSENGAVFNNGRRLAKKIEPEVTSEDMATEFILKVSDYTQSGEKNVFYNADPSEANTCLKSVRKVQTDDKLVSHLNGQLVIEWACEKSFYGFKAKKKSLLHPQYFVVQYAICKPSWMK